jgi:hypothetical protein
VDVGELLHRLATTVRADIAPAVGDEYTRTQAFMTAVILEKLAREVARGPADEAAARADLAGLHPAIETLLASAPEPVASAAARARRAGTVEALGPLVTELYRWGVGPGSVGAAALAEIRTVLRADIDRRMEIAR